MIWLYGIQQSYSLHTTSIAWLLMKAKESGKKSYYDYNDFSWEINAIKSQEHTLIWRWAVWQGLCTHQPSAWQKKKKNEWLDRKQYHLTLLIHKKWRTAKSAIKVFSHLSLRKMIMAKSSWPMAPFGMGGEEGLNCRFVFSWHFLFFS